MRIVSDPPWEHYSDSLYVMLYTPPFFPVSLLFFLTLNGNVFLVIQRLFFRVFDSQGQTCVTAAQRRDKLKT